ncbi:NAD-dependent protein deacylase Sirt4 [Halotydeus destructor]|nr:NAD-dependent protein deacylase Sirt4 [Halotydeus destructor]
MSCLPSTLISLLCSKNCSVRSRRTLSHLAQSLGNFVPKHELATDDEVEALSDFLSFHRTITVLTGAGISTESGLPDYRSEEVGLYARSNHKPIEQKEFVENEERRKRYWARNYNGWPRLVNIQPNIAHRTLADWESRGKINLLVTQNVDRLHQKAGSKNVIELHGSGYTVKCLSCTYRVARTQFQNTLDSLNGHLKEDFARASDEIRPDGDVELSESLVSRFIVAPCPGCGGLLKPDIVFFGDNVPKERVLNVYRSIESTEALLVIGSSLHVYSGYRFILHAKDHGKPTAIVSIGKSRADHLDNVLFVRRRAGDILPRIRF